MRFYNESPWGFEVEDVRLGVLASTIARAAGAKVRARDFMMRPPEEAAETVDADEDTLKSLFGG